MPSVDITQQAIVVEAPVDVSVVEFTSVGVTVEVPSTTLVLEFGTAGVLVPGSGLTGGGTMTGNVPIGLSPATVASLLKADTAIQAGANLSAFVDDVGYATDAEVFALLGDLGGAYQPLNEQLTSISGLATTVFGRSFLTLANEIAARTLIGVYSTSEVLGLLALKANASHTHTTADITGGISWSNLTGIPLTFPPGAHNHVKADVTDFAHTHVMADLTDYVAAGTWGSITGTLSAQTDLQAALDAKSTTGHIHDDRYYTETEVDGLLTGLAVTGHTHPYLPLVGGTLTGNLIINNTEPAVTFIESDAPADEQRWRWVSSAGNLYLQTRTDANGTGENTMSLFRTGANVTQLDMLATNVRVTGANFIVNTGDATGTLYLGSANAIGKEQRLRFVDSVYTSGVDLLLTGNSFGIYDRVAAGWRLNLNLTTAAVTFYGTVLAPSFTEGGTALASKYAALAHTHSYLPLAGGVITHSADSASPALVELNQVEGTAVRAIYLRFHQDNRWYYRIRANNSGFAVVGGADDVYTNLYAGTFFEDNVALSSKYAAISHTHAASAITSGEFNYDRVRRSKVIDHRSETYLYPAPNQLQGYSVEWYFNDSWGGSSWRSGFSVAGWDTSSYAVWQMSGSSTNVLQEDWYLRSGVGGSWGAWRTIMHSGNPSVAGNLYWNNSGGDHGDTTDFNAVTHFGPKFLQAGTNGPGITSATQYYTWSMGLGANYPYTTYVAQFAIPRGGSGGNPVLCVRFRENGTWGSWSGVAAGFLQNGSYRIQPENGSQWRITTPHGNLDIGPANSGYAHYSTGATYGHYFTQDVTFGAVPRKYQLGALLWHASANEGSGVITHGTGTPSGGANGDVHFQYT